MIYGKKYWGSKVWYLLHAFSVNNNLKIPENKKHNYYIFYTSLIYLLPCSECARHYTNIIYEINILDEDKIDRKYIKRWVFDTHNIVNDILDKKIYKYSKLKKDYIDIDTNKLFYTLEILLKNLNYDNMSILTYDQVYNFFINFCILFPNKIIRKNLTSVIERNHFDKISNPIQFEKWLKEYFFTIS
jgi:arsenate reductase-like glutaredoxin family protein